MTKDGKTQSYARFKNNEIILNLLRKKVYSATELAAEMKLSNAALSQIICELSSKKLIKSISSGEQNARGRHRKYLALNGDYGMIVAVGFSDNEIHIAFSDFAGKIVYEERISERLNYDFTIVYKTILLINKIYGKKFKDIPLLSVNLSVPGKVNNEAMTIAKSVQFNKLIGDNEGKLIEVFGHYFDVPVRIFNDMNLSLLAEQEALGEQRRNFILLHIDAGVGGAFYLNEKIYEGDHGFAGELGMMPVLFDGEKTVLDSAASFTSVAERLSEKEGRAFTINELKGLYFTSQNVRNEFLRSAAVAGDAVGAVAEIFDIGCVIVNGAVSAFDGEYKDTLTEAARRHDKSLNVVFSELKDSCVLGAVIAAVKKEILRAISD